MTLHQTLIDGVPVFWVDGPQPLQAHLLFRAGVRDETFMNAGLTHLAEHLTMSTIPPRRHDNNASVDVTFTAFTAAGRPEAVSTFLSDVCASLTHPNLSRLPVEKKILAAEGGAVMDPAVSEHLRLRFGLSSFGLTDVAPPALDAVMEESVLDLLQSHFTAGNAALALSGPPPEHLSLNLPMGPSCPPAAAQPLNLPYPMWFEQGGPVLGVSFEVPADTEAARMAAKALARIACERAVAELRQEHGWIYEIDYETVFDTSGRGVLCLKTDPPPAHANDVRAGLTRILRNLRDQGPTPEELRGDIQSLKDYLADPRSHFDGAIAAAQATLMGEDILRREDLLAAAQRIDVESFRPVMELFESTLLVGMPEGTSPSDEALHPADARGHLPVSGRVFRRGLRGALLSVPAGARLVIGEEGVSFVHEQTTTLAWSDVVGLDVQDGAFTLFGADSLTLTLQEAWFSKGAEALRLISERVDDRLKFTFPSQEHASPGERPEVAGR